MFYNCSIVVLRMLPMCLSLTSLMAGPGSSPLLSCAGPVSSTSHHVTGSGACLQLPAKAALACGGGLCGCALCGWVRRATMNSPIAHVSLCVFSVVFSRHPTQTQKGNMYEAAKCGKEMLHSLIHLRFFVKRFDSVTFTRVPLLAK